jgi:hypothetical protein
MTKFGSLGVCQRCDGKIVYNGEEWLHRPAHWPAERPATSVAHKAQPKARK